MDHREKSREEWERELRDDQYNIVPADGSRVGHIMAKRSATPAPIPDSAHLFRGLVSGVLLAAAVAILSSDVPYKVWLGMAALIAGCALGIAAFRWKQKND
jgi:hypothetical protein